MSVINGPRILETRDQDRAGEHADYPSLASRIPIGQTGL